MSPINEYDRHTLSASIIQYYFPTIDQDTLALAVQNASDGFLANYSPIDSEKDDPTGLGSGATFEEFCIYIGRSYTEQEPINVDQNWLGHILHCCLSI